MRALAGLLIGLCVGIGIISACSMSRAIVAGHEANADPLFRIVKDGKVGFIDSAGRLVLKPSFSLSETDGDFHEGLLRVNSGEDYRYIDHSGNTVFETKVWLAFDFSEGLAQAGLYEGAPTLPRWGFLDRSGHFAISPQFFSVDSFSEGLARVSVSREVGSTGYVDHEGRFVIPPRLSYGYDFHEGRAAVVPGGPCQIVNGGSCARLELRPTKSSPDYDCRWAYVDKSGRPISEIRFDDAGDFSEGLAPVRMGNKWGFADANGTIAISAQFDFAEPFSEGLAVAEQGGRQGFIDRSGKFVIAPQFADAESFANGRALVTESDGNERMYRFIDRQGNAAFPGAFSFAASFDHGLAPVGDQSGKYAWIDTAGKPVFEFEARWRQ